MANPFVPKPNEPDPMDTDPKTVKTEEEINHEVWKSLQEEFDREEAELLQAKYSAEEREAAEILDDLKSSPPSDASSTAAGDFQSQPSSVSLPPLLPKPPAPEAFVPSGQSTSGPAGIVPRASEDQKSRLLRILNGGPSTAGSSATGPSVTGPSAAGLLAGEPKPIESKPTESKPTEPKPTEPKPTESKPTEPKPTEPPTPGPSILRPKPLPKPLPALSPLEVEVSLAPEKILEPSPVQIWLRGNEAHNRLNEPQNEPQKKARTRPLRSLRPATLIETQGIKPTGVGCDLDDPKRSINDYLDKDALDDAPQPFRFQAEESYFSITRGTCAPEPLLKVRANKEKGSKKRVIYDSPEETDQVDNSGQAGSSEQADSSEQEDSSKEHGTSRNTEAVAAQMKADEQMARYLQAEEEMEAEEEEKARDERSVPVSAIAISQEESSSNHRSRSSSPVNERGQPICSSPITDSQSSRHAWKARSAIKVGLPPGCHPELASSLLDLMYAQDEKQNSEMAQELQAELEDHERLLEQPENLRGNHVKTQVGTAELGKQFCSILATKDCHALLAHTADYLNGLDDAESLHVLHVDECAEVFVLLTGLWLRHKYQMVQKCLVVVSMAADDDSGHERESELVNHFRSLFDVETAVGDMTLHSNSSLTMHLLIVRPSGPEDDWPGLPREKPTVNRSSGSCAASSSSSQDNRESRINSLPHTSENKPPYRPQFSNNRKDVSRLICVLTYLCGSNKLGGPSSIIWHELGILRVLFGLLQAQVVGDSQLIWKSLILQNQFNLTRDTIINNTSRHRFHDETLEWFLRIIRYLSIATFITDTSTVAEPTAFVSLPLLPEVLFSQAPTLYLSQALNCINHHTLQMINEYRESMQGPRLAPSDWQRLYNTLKLIRFNAQYPLGQRIDHILSLYFVGQPLACPNLGVKFRTDLPATKDILEVYENPAFAKSRRPGKFHVDSSQDNEMDVDTPIVREKMNQKLTAHRRKDSIMNSEAEDEG
ncbi:hypothetical protein BT63DRAFT_193866 [Microthyrium microscopicum]|uniref:Uncharacterized protein n=1 Tax=Microthyrium microscopicum TaxID=703497 RepID=A0A6A6ULK5_9PEZI|nr:hypothetical protein BT63DRAFT_193866 [Microthyrium microscopicum]